MPKKLVVFCDGTWNDLRKEIPTNIVRLAKSVAERAADGSPQIAYYDEGVGVPSRVSWLIDQGTKYIGGALGSGLDQKIEAAYRFLVLNFEPDDEIYIFGFSRGAYTARSLCGLIRKCGILRRTCFTKVPEAVQRYRNNVFPTSPEMVQFRADYAYPLATGREDHQRFGVKGTPSDIQREDAGTRKAVYQYRPEGYYRIMFAGIFDTVGALGVPTGLDLLRWNRRYKFHDTNASSLLSSIRHAVAANEKRGLFDVTPYNNLDLLNVQWAAATGWNVDDPADPRFIPYAHRPYQQRWFPGDHCSIGGGHSDTGLSSASLLWMAEGARWAGLDFDGDETGELAAAKRADNPFAPLGQSGSAGKPRGKLREAGPANLDEVADPLWRRWAAAADYRPPNVEVMLGAAPGERTPDKLPKGFPVA